MKARQEDRVADKAPKTKTIVNRSSGKVEISIEGKAYPLLPGQSMKVPEYVQIPMGVGLVVR